MASFSSCTLLVMEEIFASFANMIDVLTKFFEVLDSFSKFANTQKNLGSDAESESSQIGKFQSSKSLQKSVNSKQETPTDPNLKD